MAKLNKFRNIYGISILEFASLVHVDPSSVRRFLDCEPLQEQTSKKIEVGLSIFDNDLFHFEPLIKKSSSDSYLDKLEKIERWERQVKEFTDIFNQCMDDEEYMENLIY